MEWREMKQDMGPISVNNPTLLTWVTTASTTSPLNGRNTMALYFTGYRTKPLPGWITPAPMLSIVVTAMTKPYFPVQVPSTSVNSFCFTVLRRLGPKYLGCSKISCSSEITETRRFQSQHSLESPLSDMACNIVFRLFRPAVVTQILSLRSASASLGKSAAVVTRTRLFSSDPPETISCFPVPYRKDLPYDIVELMEEIETKWGFLPNFFKVLSHRPAEFRAFYAYYNELMNQEAGSLTKADRELIVVATSMYNKCPYCVISHSAMHRIYSKNPALADQVVVNYQNAGLCRREHVMLDFAMAVCRCDIITEEHFQSLEAVGFDREDAWDIAAITAFFSMSNRFAQFTNLKPNIEFYNMARIPWNKLGKEAEEEWK